MSGIMATSRTGYQTWRLSHPVGCKKQGKLHKQSSRKSWGDDVKLWYTFVGGGLVDANKSLTAPNWMWYLICKLRCCSQVISFVDHCVAKIQ